MAAFLCVVLLADAANAQADATPEIAALEETSFQQAVAAVDPSVVRIETVGGVDLVGEVLTAAGPTTGVVVSADGFIITSRFNFISKPTSIVVTLADGTKLPAQIVGDDMSRMLTLLKVDASGLSPIQPAPVESSRIGSWALAVGRTFELEFPNLSVGIVSAIERLNGRAIQTDAKVSPLNYGGPLVDLAGRALGVLVPLSPQQTDETAGVEWYDGGIGFAVPMADIYRVLPRLQAGETLKQGLIGIQFQERGPLAGTPKIQAVRPESPGDKAGLEAGDVILSVDNVAVSRIPLLQRELGKRYAGDTVTLKVKRGEQTLDFTVELAAELLPYQFASLGILPQRNGAPELGVGIRAVMPDGPAAVAGMKPGDVLVSLADRDITDFASLLEVLRPLRPGTEVAASVLRDRANVPLRIKLGGLTTEVPAELVPEKEVVPEEAAPESSTGRLSDTLPGRELKYWSYVPENYHPERPLGMLVWLHPGGDSMEAEVLRLFRDHCHQRGILLLAPLAGDVAGWSADDVEAIADLVRHFQKEYKVDPHRIAVCGLEDSVPVAFQLAFKHRDLIRGIAGTNGVYRQRVPDNDPDYRCQILLTGFEGTPATELLKRFSGILAAMNYPVSLNFQEGAANGSLTAEWTENTIRWLDSLDRI
ncbi:MAG: PDZ domain-containing protein [Planctomycetaceae bacterium]|nr:PDZ domain-containing protein [Planctomycetaceae bacterium]MCB9951011.1 PDZ domain-containing protein [Planctomycetaceae bacterium]